MSSINQPADGKSIIDYLPLASAVFLVLGALRLIFFYKFFGIDIVSFIDLSEVITLSFAFFINGVFALLIFLVVFIPTITDAQIKGVEDKKTGATGWLMISAFIIYSYFTMYDIAGNYIVAFRVNYDTLIMFAVIIFIFVFSSKILPIIKRNTFYYFGYDVNGNISAILVLFVSICALCVLQSRDSARDILFKKKPEYVEIKVDSLLLKTNYTYRFVGKTRNYAFFYNTTTNICDVYSVEGDKDRKLSFPNELPNLQIGGMK